MSYTMRGGLEISHVLQWEAGTSTMVNSECEVLSHNMCTSCDQAIFTL